MAQMPPLQGVPITNCGNSVGCNFRARQFFHSSWLLVCRHDHSLQKRKFLCIVLFHVYSVLDSNHMKIMSILLKYPPPEDIGVIIQKVLNFPEIKRLDVPSSPSPTGMRERFKNSPFFSKVLLRSSAVVSKEEQNDVFYIYFCVTTLFFSEKNERIGRREPEA